LVLGMHSSIPMGSSYQTRAQRASVQTVPLDPFFTYNELK